MKKGRKTKLMRVDERLKHIFEAVAEQITKEENKSKPDKWSKTVNDSMWFLCKNLYPDLTRAILKSYAMAEDVIENEPIVKEVIQNESSNL